jgi:hypothetical protein
METAVVVVLRRKRLWLCRFSDCCAGQEDGVELWTEGTGTLFKTMLAPA